MSNPTSILRLSSAARAMAMDHPAGRRATTPAAVLSGATVIILLLAAAVWGWQQWRRLVSPPPVAERTASENEASVAYIALPRSSVGDASRSMAESSPPASLTGAAKTATGAAKAENSGTKMPASAARPATRELSPADRGAVAALRESDSRLAQRDFAGAQAALEKIFASTASPEYLAQAAYRLGYAAHLQGDMAAARRTWQKGVDDYHQTTAGRLCALALADLRYEEAAGAQPRYAEWESIRDLYSLAVGMDGAPFIPGEAKARAIRRLMRLNEYVVFSPAPCKGAIFHTVSPGESLAVIARRYGVHYASLIAINRVRPQALRPGMKLKIIKADCTIVVDKRELTCTWYLDGKWIKQYPCCVGPDNKTPAGVYTIDRKCENPPWTNPADGKRYEYGDPNNILGTRWMAIRDGRTEGLGIHGTTLPQSIPGRTSNGCVRLRNEDVEELYGFALIGSQVIIRD